MLRFLPFVLLSALLFAACGGGSTSPEELTPGPASTDLHLTSKGMKFDKKALAAPANSNVSLTFSNDDSGVLHNVSVYKDKGAKDKVYVGELISGRKIEVYEFRTPAAGQYFFRCDAHPDMNGTFFVQ